MNELTKVAPYIVILFAFILAVFLIFEGIEYVKAGEWKLSFFFFFFTLFSLAIGYSSFTLIKKEILN
jgi:hypothetical protein